MQNCPKCSRPAKDTDMACAKCGLLRSHWSTYTDPSAAPHPTLDPLWEQALADWQEEKRHSALAMIVGQDFHSLSVLAQRYSAVLRQRPDDAVAKAALDRLLGLAVQLPVPSRGPGGETRLMRVGKALLGLSMLILSTYLFYLLFRR